MKLLRVVMVAALLWVAQPSSAGLMPTGVRCSSADDGKQLVEWCNEVSENVASSSGGYSRVWRVWGRVLRNSVGVENVRLVAVLSSPVQPSTVCIGWTDERGLVSCNLKGEVGVLQDYEITVSIGTMVDRYKPKLWRVWLGVVSKE